MATTAPTNGRAAHAKFQPGWEPEHIALKAIPGKGVTGFNGDQVLFHLTNGRPWYADIYVSQAIEEMRIQPGEVFEVCKTTKQRGGRSITEVQIKAVVEPEPTASSCQSPAAGHQGTANTHSTSNGTTPRPSAPASAPAATAANGHCLPQSQQLPQTPPTAGAPVNGKGETSADQLARCFRTSIDIVANAVLYAKAQGLVVAPCFEDLRCAAHTLYISESGRR
jgi:hypothetical protein